MITVDRPPLHASPMYEDRWHTAAHRHRDDAWGRVTSSIDQSLRDTAEDGWLVGLDVVTEYPIGPPAIRIGRSSIGCDLGGFAAGGDAPATESHLAPVYGDCTAGRPTSLPPAWRSPPQRIV